MAICGEAGWACVDRRQWAREDAGLHEPFNKEVLALLPTILCYGIAVSGCVMFILNNRIPTYV